MISKRGGLGKNFNGTVTMDGNNDNGHYTTSSRTSKNIGSSTTITTKSNDNDDNSTKIDDDTTTTTSPSNSNSRRKNNNSNNNNNNNNNIKKQKKSSKSKSSKSNYKIFLLKYSTIFFFMIATFSLGMLVVFNHPDAFANDTSSTSSNKVGTEIIDAMFPTTQTKQRQRQQQQRKNHYQSSSGLRPLSSTAGGSTATTDGDNNDRLQWLLSKLPPSFAGLIHRAKYNKERCGQLGMNHKKGKDLTNLNNHTAHLQQYGMLTTLKNYDPNQKSSIDYTNDYGQCELPPETECNEKQFTVIFMAYKPDRLSKLFNQVRNMVKMTEFSTMVAEIVLVWNGSSEINESSQGRALLDLIEQKYPVRIEYPLKKGFPNDLMNRYHPSLNIKTKAVMYYDDDGPFYSAKATLGGFELWKRNSNAQIGAMARKLDLCPRQLDEKQSILMTGQGGQQQQQEEEGNQQQQAEKESAVPIPPEVADRFFISHCPSDEVNYNFFEFANFGANMVLPSGSFLHSNYLCFIWHPIFDDVRTYIRDHPVNPDDGTVSMIVSQLGGRAPKVYSRRINESKEEKKKQEQEKQQQRRRRRLSSLENSTNTNYDDDVYENDDDNDEYNSEEYEEHLWHQAQHNGFLDKIIFNTTGTSSDSSSSSSSSSRSRSSNSIDEDGDFINNIMRTIEQEEEKERFSDQSQSQQLLLRQHHRQRHHEREQLRRRLMFDLNWDASGAHDMKNFWGRLRTDAANSLTRYFGSINSGSLGWCFGTVYHKQKANKNGGDGSISNDICEPEMARIGKLPWLKSDHTPLDTCP